MIDFVRCAASDDLDPRIARYAEQQRLLLVRMNGRDDQRVRAPLLSGPAVYAYNKHGIGTLPLPGIRLLMAHGDLGVAARIDGQRFRQRLIHLLRRPLDLPIQMPPVHARSKRCGDDQQAASEQGSFPR